MRFLLRIFGTLLGRKQVIKLEKYIEGNDEYVSEEPESENQGNIVAEVLADAYNRADITEGSVEHDLLEKDMVM